MNKHPLIITFVLITLCLLPMMILRDFSPDNELRYLQIADEAIENGNVFAFTLQGEAYADKPPLYLWLVMLSRLLLGKHSMLLLALFSLIPSFVIIAVMDKWAGLVKPADRVGVAFMMMTCALFLGASVFLRMDMMMTMFIVLALYSFWQLYDHSVPEPVEWNGYKKHEILLPVWIFLALFTKGPVGILMPPLAIISFLLVKKKGRDIGKYLGWKTWGIIAGLCAIWFTGVYLDGGKDYLNNLLFHQTMGRAVNSFHHKAPFWYYFAAIWYIVAPYMFLLVGAVVVSLKDMRRDVRGDKEIFFLATILSTFVMLSLFSGKLAIYLSPIMPFMVLLFVEVLKRTGWKKWMTWSLAVPSALLAILAIAALGILFFGDGNSRLKELLEPYSFARSGMVKFALFLLFQGFALAMYYLWKKRPNLSLTRPLHHTHAHPLPCGLRPPARRERTSRRDVADYQRDFSAFYEAEIKDRKTSDGPLVLVTQSKRLDRDAALGEFAKTRNHWFVGPYCLVQVEGEPESLNIETNENTGSYEQ